MKKLVLVLIAAFVVTTFAFAQTAKQPQTSATTTVTVPATTTTPAPAVEALTLKGNIIDNRCAGTQTPEKLAEFVKTHTKECALMPACVASGYSIFADGKLQKFDKDSNAKIEKFLKKADSKLQVVVVAKKTGDKLSLVSIENQK